MAVRRVARIYGIEAELKDLSDDERRAQRQQLAKPLWESSSRLQLERRLVRGQIRSGQQPFDPRRVLLARHCCGDLLAMSKPQNPQHFPQQKAKKVVAATPMPPSRARADWEAIERDYRTGKFSDQELREKHGSIVSRQAISQKAKRNRWQKDLSAAVRLATNATLIEAQVRPKVAGDVAKGCDETLNVVLAAAEVNKQVILAHRAEIARLRSTTMTIMEMLEQQLRMAKVGEKDINLGEALLSVQRASLSLTRLQQAERKAFSLDEPDDPAGAETNKGTTLTLAQRASRLASLLEQAGKARAAALASADGSTRGIDEAR